MSLCLVSRLNRSSFCGTPSYFLSFEFCFTREEGLRLVTGVKRGLSVVSMSHKERYAWSKFVLSEVNEGLIFYIRYDAPNIS